MSMLEVMQLQGETRKKYVLQNTLTGIVLDRRFWTIRGARRAANKNIRQLNRAFSRANKRYGKV